MKMSSFEQHSWEELVREQNYNFIYDMKTFRLFMESNEIHYVQLYLVEIIIQFEEMFNWKLYSITAGL